MRLVGVRDVRAGPRPGRVSAWHLLLHASGGGIYLEVAASVTTFLLAGRLYEAKARRDAGDAMRELAAAGARDACVLEDDGTERRVPVADLARASGSWCARVSGSPPTGRWSSASPRWTAA